ncbi:MAG: sigma-70 family RNA polymerase sigma factor [Oscillospiraceae bacterium]|nr:sigma-70 family RNA polymerase sigma factor [Oscillospiraceae bacterium]
MWEKNNGSDANSVLQNQFTAYLMTAVRNQKILYLRKLSKLQQYELPLELQETLVRTIEEDPVFDLILLQKLEGERLYLALKQINDRNRYIFFAKALDEKTFAELAKELGMSYGAVAMAYHRTIERIRQAMGGDTE